MFFWQVGTRSIYKIHTTISFKVRIFWEGHLLLTTVHKTKVRWRFCKTLWSSQSIWTSIRLILGQNSHLILYASLENLTTHIAHHLTFYARLWFFFCLKAKVLMCDLHNEVALIRKPFISQKVVKEWRWASYLNSRGMHYR